MAKAISSAASFQAHVYGAYSIRRKCGYSMGTDLYENCTWICPGKWQDLGKEKLQELLLAFCFLHASLNARQKQDTKQQQTGKDLEMAEYLLL